MTLVNQQKYTNTCLAGDKGNRLVIFAAGPTITGLSNDCN